jgi:PST family polysaccharide transporter
MSDSNNIKSGFFWLTSGTVFQALIKIVTTAVLSRLISAADFGVVTFALTIVGLAELLTQISLGKSLVQKEVITERHVLTAFSFSVFTGIFLALTFIVIVNPFLASIFEYPNLLTILNILVALFPIRAISQVSFGLLQREKDFKSIAGLDALSYLLGYGIIGISLAYLGLGVWAIVIGSVVVGITYSLLLYWRSRFPLRFLIDKEAFREMFDFGTKYSLIRIVNYGALKGDYLVVARVLGVHSLGIYSRAYTLMDSVNAILGKVLYTLLFPFFATDKKDNEAREMGLVMVKLIAVMLNIILPFSILCFIYADLIVMILLGSAWTEAILVFRVLSVSMVARVGYKLVSTFLLSEATINNNLFVQCLYFLMIVTGTFFGSFFFDLTGAAIAVTITLFTVFILFLLYFVRANENVSIVSILKASAKGIALGLFFLFCNILLRQVITSVTDSLTLQATGVVVSNTILGFILYVSAGNVFFEKPLVAILNSILHKIR